MRVCSSAIAACNRDIARWPSVETGGLLLGRDHGNLLDVAAATDAGPNATRETDCFALDPTYCRELIADLQPGVSVVGEWHVHIDAPALPSREDAAAFARMCKRGGGSYGVVIFERSPATGRWQWRAFVTRGGATRPALCAQTAWEHTKGRPVGRPSASR